MKKLIRSLKYILVSSALICGSLAVFAQNSLPAPGSGGGFQPAGGLPAGGFGGGFGPTSAPSNWGSPWYMGQMYNPPVVPVSVPVTVAQPNQGLTKVIACGYDAQGVWRVFPMLVSYQWNGVQYNVNVLNAWNPWTDQWNKGIDESAYNTDYYLKNIQYDYYTVLPWGTFYFNL